MTRTSARTHRDCAIEWLIAEVERLREEWEKLYERGLKGRL